MFIILAFIIKDHSKIALDNPRVYKTFLIWDNLEQEEK